MIRVTIENNFCKIEGLDNQDTIDRLSFLLSYEDFSLRYAIGKFAAKNLARVRMLSKRLVFPTGLLPKVFEFLHFNYEKEDIEFIDKREFLAGPNAGIWTGPKLFDYQEQIVDTAINEKAGMIHACTGAGKSIMIAKLCHELNLPTIIGVVTEDLLFQLYEDFVNFFGKDKVGIVGSGYCIPKQFTIASVWTLARAVSHNAKVEKDDDCNAAEWAPTNHQQKEQIKQLMKDAKVVILDEAHFAGASAIQKFLEFSTGAPFRFGFTGTPWRMNGDDMLLESAFGKVICKLSASELIKRGFLVKPKIMFLDIPKYDKDIAENWQAVKNNYFLNNSVRDDIIVNHIIKMRDMGKRPLLLFRDIAYGMKIKNLLPNDIKLSFVSGAVTKEKRKAVKEDYESGKIDLIMASVIYDQGVNIPSLDGLVLLSGGKSTSKALQRIGRVIRSAPGKKSAFVMDTFDQVQYGEAHSLSRYKIYATEPEFKLGIGNAFNHYLVRKGII